MPKKSEVPLQKHTLNLYEGDFDELCALYPAIKPSNLVRELVRNTIQRTKANALDASSIEINTPLTL